MKLTEENYVGIAEQAIKAAVSDYYKRRGVDPEPIVGNVPECDSCGCEG